MKANPRQSRRRLAIFARAPIRGRIKTRLAEAIGADAALAAYEELLEVTLSRLRPGVGNFAPEIWVDGHGPLVDDWRRRFPVIDQPPGDLGTKMAAAFADGVTVIVGSDIPTITAGYIEAALGALAGADLVIGPAEDGGYCLIAMNAPRPEVFTGIPWGTGEVLGATLDAAKHLKVKLLNPLWDVDNAADLARWRALDAMDAMDNNSV